MMPHCVEVGGGCQDKQLLHKNCHLGSSMIWISPFVYSCPCVVTYVPNINTRTEPSLENDQSMRDRVWSPWQA